MEQDKQIDNEIESADDSIKRVYELGYLLVPTLEETDVPAAYGNIKEFISLYGGGSIAEDMPKMITLAYPMLKVINNVHSKFKTAYFGWVKFTMDSDKVLELKEKLKMDANLLRFLIIKTVKENTIAAKKFGRGETRGRVPKKNGNSESAAPINKEEIDKEIEALIAA